ncbi:MAG: response regulator transcription factor [Streptococcaceae bacterium]|jgi:two-component system response regulator VanR|nr:response regulator transcription factor [Streptococcaceae bacterium]
MNKKILVVEDEAAIQEILKNYLEEEGYQVTLASDGLEGFTKFGEQEFDLLLLDIMMPKIDGYTLLEMIRKQSNVPVIMLSAMSQVQDQKRGFKLKVDDYIVKPFDIGLVLMRIEALLRRSVPVENISVIRYKNLSLFIDAHSVEINDKAIMLTNKEFELLKLFLENQNQVFTREHLLDSIWGYDFFGNPNVVNVHIKNLRKKIGEEYLETVRGVGYKLTKE